MWQLNWQFFVAGLVCGSAIAAGLFLGNKAFAGGKGGGTRCYSATLKVRGGNMNGDSECVCEVGGGYSATISNDACAIH